MSDPKSIGELVEFFNEQIDSIGWNFEDLRLNLSEVDDGVTLREKMRRIDEIFFGIAEIQATMKACSTQLSEIETSINKA